MFSPATAISLLVLASLLLGLARDLTVAYYFGADWHADLYFLALIIPLFVENSLALSVRDALVPALLQRKEEGAVAYRDLIARSAGGLLLAGLGLWLVFATLPGIWINLMDESGLAVEHGPELRQAYQLGVSMIPLMLWLYFLAGISHAQGAFVLPAWRGVLFNIGGILALVLVSRSTQALLTGMVAGLLLHVLLLQVAMGGVRLQWPRLHLEGLHNRLLLQRFLTLLAVALLLQLAIGAERLLANLTGEGGLSRLSYAFRIVTVPLVVFTFAVMGIAYARFARAAAQTDGRVLGQAFVDTSRICLFLLLPTAVALTVFAEEVLSLLLYRGAFTSRDVQQAAQLMQIYAAGLPAMGLAVMLTRMVVALDRFRPLLLAIGIAVAATMVLYLVASRHYGIHGLALATSAGAYLQCALLWRAVPTACRGVVGWRDTLASVFTVLLLALVLPLLSPLGLPGLLAGGVVALALPVLLYGVFLRGEFVMSLGRAMGRQSGVPS